MQTDSDTFHSILSPVEAIPYKEKRSKFLGYAYPVTDLKTIQNHIASIRRIHPNARHCCYAYRLGAPCKAVYALHDDGEPSKTAGLPIYNRFLSGGLSDILLIVIRYFGGIKLGTGGLMRAYKSCADETLEKASTIEKYLYEKYLLESRYDQMSRLYQIAKQWDALIDDQSHEDKCQLHLSLRNSKAPSFEEALKNLGMNYIKME